MPTFLPQRSSLVAAVFALCALLSPVQAAEPPVADFRLLTIDGFRVKWGDPRLGTGAHATYGFVTGLRHFDDALNCGDMAPIEGIAAAWRHDPAALERAVSKAFALWGAAAAITFREAAAGEEPDILIGVQGTPRRVAFANVWLDRTRAANGVAPLTRAAICFNPTLDWQLDATGPAKSGGKSADFGTVLAHEIGHTLGLDHPGAAGALMGYSDQGDIDWLMPGDVSGIRVLYGAPRDF